MYRERISNDILAVVFLTKICFYEFNPFLLMQFQG
jgi:hypothetical protein